MSGITRQLGRGLVVIATWAGVLALAADGGEIRSLTISQDFATNAYGGAGLSASFDPGLGQLIQVEGRIEFVASGFAGTISAMPGDWVGILLDYEINQGGWDNWIELCWAILPPNVEPTEVSLVQYEPLVRDLLVRPMGSPSFGPSQNSSPQYFTGIGFGAFAYPRGAGQITTQGTITGRVSLRFVYEAAAAPEPATWVSMAMGSAVLAMIGRGRRRRRRIEPGC